MIRDVVYCDVIDLWRCWRITPYGALRAVFMNAEWAPGWNVADCRPWVPSDPRTGSVTHPTFPLCAGDAFVSHTCGFWALDSLDQARSYVSKPFTVVYGTVQLAGRFVHGTKGWRAERARVTSLMLPVLDDLKQRLKGLHMSDQHVEQFHADLVGWVRLAAERYDVPVVATDGEVTGGYR